jgi:hypothetical protein
MIRRKAEDRARYDPEKVRRRAEEALGWELGSSRDMSFRMLAEMLKSKPEKWKALNDIEDMLRTGDHLDEPVHRRREPDRIETLSGLEEPLDPLCDCMDCSVAGEPTH